MVLYMTRLIKEHTTDFHGVCACITCTTSIAITLFILASITVYVPYFAEK